MNVRISDHISDQISDQISEQMRYHISVHIGDQSNDQINEQIRGQIGVMGKESAHNGKTGSSSMQPLSNASLLKSLHIGVMLGA